MEISYHCRECGKVAITGVDDQGEEGALYCPDHPTAVIESIGVGTPHAKAQRYEVTFHQPGYKAGVNRMGFAYPAQREWSRSVTVRARSEEEEATQVAVRKIWGRRAHWIDDSVYAGGQVWEEVSRRLGGGLNALTSRVQVSVDQI